MYFQDIDTMTTKCKPFLKWPGGKRWIIKHLSNHTQNISYKNYLEPFLGGGAVFFDLTPKRSVLSDINPNLIETYEVVKQSCSELIEILKSLPIDNSTYYKIRESVPKNSINRAARFIYLNRLAFGGIYRVNKDGQFNVPYGGGRRVDILWKNNMLTMASKALAGVKLYCCDFEVTIDKARCNDLVYCDPTYIATNTNGFTRYNEAKFSWEDQQRLAKAVFRAAKRGATIIVSNGAHNEIAELYKPFKPTTITRHTCISRIPEGRKPVEEYLFVINKNK